MLQWLSEGYLVTHQCSSLQVVIKQVIHQNNLSIGISSSLDKRFVEVQKVKAESNVVAKNNIVIIGI